VELPLEDWHDSGRHLAALLHLLVAHRDLVRPDASSEIEKRKKRKRKEK
jgi:hypothetical protein